jgi:phosphoesterase RecJ-like protein
MSVINAAAFHEAKAFIADCRRAVLFSHEKPDGDAIGALVAMRATLRNQGIVADAVLFDPLPDRYAFFRDNAAIPVFGKDFAAAKLDDYDAAMILDTCSFSQLRPIADWLRRSSVPLLVVDHHATRDPIGTMALIEERAAATCLVLYDWFRTVGWALSEEASRALFVGIATDTGWFRHSNTDDRVLAVCADLVARGVQPNPIYQALYQRESASRVRLLGAALGSLELRAGSRLAVMTLDPPTFAACAATPADTEDLVNEPLRIRSVLVSILLVDQGDGTIRVNFRSKAGEQPDVDVSALAGGFGGGGHRRAAGAKVSGVLSAVRADVVAAAARILEGA